MSKRSVAAIGASNDRRKLGNKAVCAYRESGNKVFRINSRKRSIEGLAVFTSIAHTPGLKKLPAIAERKPHGVWLNPSSESDELIEAAADLHLRVIVACSILAHGLSPGEISDT